MAIIKKPIKKAQNGVLTKKELDALSHQKRGMGTVDRTFVKKAGGIQNETGTLTDAQVKQLKKHMSKAGVAKKIYEGLPNAGRILGHGNSAADVPKGSQLEKQRKGGMIKKRIPKADILKVRGVIAKKGASVKKMQYGGSAASMVPPKKKGVKMKKAMMGSSMDGSMMKDGGKMKKCKYGCN